MLFISCSVRLCKPTNFNTSPAAWYSNLCVSLGAVHNSLDSPFRQRWQVQRTILQALLPTSHIILYKSFCVAVYVASVDSSIAGALVTQSVVHLHRARVCKFGSQRL